MALRDIQANVGSQAQHKAGETTTKEKSFDKRDQKPIVNKSPTKNTKEEARETEDDVIEVIEPNPKSNKGGNEDSSSTPAEKVGLINDRPEPLAVVTSRTLDFYNSGGHNSPILSILKTCVVEDAVSTAYSNSLIEKLKAEDPDAVMAAEEAIENNVVSAKNTLNALDTILREVRHFDKNLVPGTGANQIALNAREIAEEYGGLDEFLFNLNGGSYITDHVTMCKNICASPAHPEDEEYIKGKTNTAILGMNLRSFHEYMTRGYSYDLTPEMKKKLFHAGQQKGTKKKSSYIAAQTTYKTTPSNEHTGKDIVTRGGPYDRTGVVTVRVGPSATSSSALLRILSFGFIPKCAPFFHMKEKLPLKRSKMLVTQFVNEMLISAGMGRLDNTELGKQYGVAGNNTLAHVMETFTGSPGNHHDHAGNTGQSLSSIFIVDSGGNPTSYQSKGSKIKIFDGNTIPIPSNAKNKGVWSATDYFAKAVARGPLKNRMSNYDESLQNASSKIAEGLEFFQQLHNRDNDLKILTPKKLFTRILKEVNESIGKLGHSMTNISASGHFALQELAMFAKVGEHFENDDHQTHTNMARMMLFKLACTHAYKELSGTDSNVWGSSPDYVAGVQNETTTTVKVKKNGGPQDTFVIKSSSDKKGHEEKGVEVSDTIAFSTDDADFFENGQLPAIAMVAYCAGLEHVTKGMGNQSNTMTVPWGKEGNLGTLQRSSGGEHGAGLDNIMDLYTEFLTSPAAASLCKRLADVFIECHEEAREIAKSGPSKSNFLNGNRYTRASGLDAGTLMGMIFETAAALAFQFSPVTHGWGRLSLGGDRDQSDVLHDLMIPMVDMAWKYGDPFPSGFLLGGVSQTKADEVANILNGMWLNLQLVGEPGTNIHSALNTLINCSETNDFTSAYDDNDNIPALGTDATHQTVVSSGYPVVHDVTYRTIERIFTDLALEREIPFALLLSNAGFIKYCCDSQNSLITIGNELRKSVTPRDELVDFTTFVKTAVGENFIPSFTDSSLTIAKERMARVLEAKNSPVYRNAKITTGEMNAIQVLISKIASLTSESVVFSFIGLPADFYREIILPKFHLINGFDTAPEYASIDVTIKSYDVFSSSARSNLSKTFSAERLIDSNSFKNLQPDMTFENIVDAVKLKNGLFGHQFIKAAIAPDKAREMLTNEVNSHLCKKMFSIICAGNFFAHDLVDFNYNERDPGSRDLANLFAKVSKIKNLDFSKVFDPPKGKRTGTEYKPTKLMGLTGVSLRAEAWVQHVDFLPLSFGAADMFADLFSSLLFNSSLLSSFIFSPGYFDKTMCLYYTPDDFAPVEEDDDIVVMDGGHEVMNDDNEKNIDKTPSSVSIRTYECYADVGEPIIVEGIR